MWCWIWRFFNLSSISRSDSSTSSISRDMRLSASTCCEVRGVWPCTCGKVAGWWFHKLPVLWVLERDFKACDERGLRVLGQCGIFSSENATPRWFAFRRSPRPADPWFPQWPAILARDAQYSFWWSNWRASATEEPPREVHPNVPIIAAVSGDIHDHRGQDARQSRRTMRLFDWCRCSTGGHYSANWAVSGEKWRLHRPAAG